MSLVAVKGQISSGVCGLNLDWAQDVSFFFFSWTF